MKDEELLEWYKNNPTKPVDMTQKDYEINRNNALKLQQDVVLKQNLESQQAAIAKAQSQAQQSASISNEKLMKYLGQTQLSNGIAKGQTSTDFINANNSYLTNRANIANNALDKQTELLNSYTSNKLANEQDAYNNEIAILDKYRQRDIEDKQLQQADEDRQQADEDRQRDIQKWELEMDAYRQELQNIMEDRQTSREEKVKAEQESQDIYWLEAANDRINSMITSLMDKKGNLSDLNKSKIDAELESYKSKFNSEDYYNKLLDLYKTLLYQNNI